MGRSLLATAKTKSNHHEPKTELISSSPTPTPSPTLSQQPQRSQQQHNQQPQNQPQAPPQQQPKQLKRQPHSEHDSSSPTPPQQSRPKRRATNAHIIRFLQTRNPNKLEEEDLKRALEASLEEHPDFWPAEDTASWSSSDQSNAPSASSNSSSTGGGRLETSAKKTNTANQTTTTTTNTTNATNTTTKRRFKSSAPTKRGLKNSFSMQQNHLFSNICNCQHAPQSSNYQTSHPTSNCSANTHCCPMSTVHNRYKPVTRKNIYRESDFFHDGIMEYIEYELYKRGVLGSLSDYGNDP